MARESKTGPPADRPRVGAEQARWYRLRKSGLGPSRFDAPEAAARALFGVQAQVNSAARLALWNRLEPRPGADARTVIEAAAEERRTLVRSWGQRGTLHLYAREDWPTACAAMAAREIARVEQRVSRLEAKDGSRTIAAYERAYGLARDLLERAPDHRVAKADLEREGGEAVAKASYGAFLKLCLEGRACRVDAGDAGGAVIASRSSLVPELDWRPPSFERAMIEIARLFFATYGPATEPDFRYWLNASAAESRAVVRALAEDGELAEVTVDDGDRPSTQLVTRTELPTLTEPAPPPSRWPLRLLGRFDPLILAHADKTCWVDDAHRRRVWHHTHIEAVLLVAGRIRGIWRTKRSRRGLTLLLQLFDDAPLDDRARRALDREARALAEFSGLPLLGIDSTRIG